MAHETVLCARAWEADPRAVWDVIRDFDVSWHPAVESCAIFHNESGAVRRVLRTTDGTDLVEQRTYISNWDRRLCYTAVSGIEGALSYTVEITVSQQATESLVTWKAEIKANAARAKEIAEGTKAIFEAGLDVLAAGVPKPVTRKSAQSPPSNLKTGRLKGVPVLSFVHGACKHETLVLFLHGIGGHASNWNAQLEAIGSAYSAAALNLRGYGDSTLGFAATQVDDYCDDILACMTHFQATRLVLVGLSYGSWIATSFATRFPDKLAGLVLAGGCTGMSEADDDEREAFRRARELPLSQGQTPADFASEVISVIAGPSASAEVQETLRSSMADIPTETYRDALRCFSNPLEKLNFAKIECPVLLMTGEHDKLASPAEIRQVSDRLRDRGMATRGFSDVQFEVLAGAGHVCNLEQPAAFNDLLGRFLGRLPGVSKHYKPSREEKRQDKRRRILEAALEEFCAAGFDGASMDRLAQVADVSKPTLYQYFGDKESLFIEVLDRGKKHIISPLLDPEGSLVDRLWRFSWTYADFVLRPDMLSLARLILGEARRRPESARRYHESGPGSALDGLEDFVAHCVSRSEIVVDDARLAANDLWSLTLSGPRDYYLHHTAERPSEGELLKAIDHGLRVFLKAYSTQPNEDLKALSVKVAQKAHALERR